MQRVLKDYLGGVLNYLESSGQLRKQFWLVHAIGECRLIRNQKEIYETIVSFYLVPGRIERMTALDISSIMSCLGVYC